MFVILFNKCKKILIDIYVCTVITYVNYDKQIINNSFILVHYMFHF